MKRPVCCFLACCVAVIVFFSSPVAKANSDDEALVIGISVTLGENWDRSLDATQIPFFAALQAEPEFRMADGIPYNRMMELFEARDLDCVIVRLLEPMPGKVLAQEEVPFDLILYIRRGDSPEKRRKIVVGHLANLPPITVPYETGTEFYGMRTIEQGQQLLLQGRIDAVITHSGRLDHVPGLTRAPLPPVLHVELSLVCHDTARARQLVAEFDKKVQSIRATTRRGEGVSSPVGNITASF